MSRYNESGRLDVDLIWLQSEIVIESIDCMSMRKQNCAQEMYLFLSSIALEIIHARQEASQIASFGRTYYEAGKN